MDEKDFVKEVITRTINSDKIDPNTKNVKCAVLLLMFSSGLPFGQIRHLTLGNFEEACNYIEDYESIETFIRLNPIKEKIIPIWDVSSGSKKRIVCSSPESTYFIFQHLCQREKLDSKDYLFLNNNGNQLDKDYTSIWLDTKFRKEILNNSNKDISNFTADKLRKYLTTKESETNKSFFKLFNGASGKNVEFNYHNWMNNKNIILKKYNDLLNYIKIDINAILKDNTSKDIVTKVGTVTKEDITVNKISTSEECENQYLQELHRQDKSLRDEITMLINDFNNIDDLVVKTKLKTIIEKKEKRLLELKREAEEWHLKMQH